MSSIISAGVVFKILGPVFLVFLVILFIRVFFEDLIPALWQRHKFNSGEKWRSGRELIRWLQAMRPAEFEDYTAHLFSKLGYKVEVTGASHDGGIDVIAEKDGRKHYIQCKKFITREVPVGAVRDFYGAMADKGADAKGIFITTNKFTLEAEKFANDKPIELVDGFKLEKYINMAKMNELPMTETSRLCPNCGGVMVKRNGKFGNFYGCSNYPKCKHTEKI
ncbi:MAG: restriction endonuclease [Patescibacteria group bacterium]|nr:restriction endonuclease [Patescibacteria group bacterium]